MELGHTVLAFVANFYPSNVVINRSFISYNMYNGIAKKYLKLHLRLISNYINKLFPIRYCQLKK